MKKTILRTIPCDAIRDRIYCIEETQGIPETISKDDPTGVVLVKKRALWPQYFTYIP
jgi:hypothetical protein